MDEEYVYAVRNDQGHWFRAKGYGGYGKSWVEDLTTAKIYGKIGTARAQATWWRNNAKMDTKVMRLVITRVEEIPGESERIAKTMKALKTRKERQEVADKKREVQYAEEQLQKAVVRLEKAKT